MLSLLCHIGCQTVLEISGGISMSNQITKITSLTEYLMHYKIHTANPLNIAEV